MTAVDSLAPPIGRVYNVRPAPRREPPFDDEPSFRHLSRIGPLDRPLPFETAAPAAPVAVRPALSAPHRMPQDLPDPGTISRTILIGIIEVATGLRPAAQLAPYMAPGVQAGLSRDAGSITRLGTAKRPARVHSVHLSAPVDDGVEVAAVLQIGQRFRAVAMRLEAKDSRWRCLRLQIG
jgi:hypothetical protein